LTPPSTNISLVLFSVGATLWIRKSLSIHLKAKGFYMCRFSLKFLYCIVKKHQTSSNQCKKVSVL